MENNGTNAIELLEEERKKIHKKSNTAYIIAALLFVVGFGTFFFIGPFSFLFFVAAVVIIVVITSERKKYQAVFKDKLVTKLIQEELGVSAVYNKTGGIKIEEINSLQVASVPDRYHTEDYISCTYNGIPYEMCDCVLEERVVTHDAQGHRHVSYKSYFKGRVIKIDFKRNLNMELKVVNLPTRGFRQNSLTAFETEVIEFNKKFKCYASSKMDGFYLLTPIMIQKMMELEKLYAGGIYYVVMHNNLYVLINNSGDSLEVNISKPLDGKQLDRIRFDILIGASIINEFRMDTDKFNVNQ